MVDCVECFFEVDEYSYYMFFIVYCICDFFNSITACDVDLLALNMYWLSENSLCISKNASILLLKSFSNTFEDCGSNETGL